MTQEPQNNTELSSLKAAHLYYAQAVQLLSVKSFYPEEFQTVANTIQFLTTLKEQVAAKIEQLEPKTEEAKTENKPYLMDLTHVKAEDANETNNPA